MNRYSLGVDYYFSELGDFFLDENTGDFLDTSLIKYRKLIQDVTTVISGRKGEWRLSPNVGANLMDFRGKPNTQYIGGLIKTRILNELTKDNLILIKDLNVYVFPVSEVEVAVSVQIKMPAVGEAVALNFTYDLRDNKIIPRNI